MIFQISDLWAFETINRILYNFSAATNACFSHEPRTIGIQKSSHSYGSSVPLEEKEQQESHKYRSLFFLLLVEDLGMDLGK